MLPHILVEMEWNLKAQLDSIKPPYVAVLEVVMAPCGTARHRTGTDSLSAIRLAWLRASARRR